MAHYTHSRQKDQSEVEVYAGRASQETKARLISQLRAEAAHLATERDKRHLRDFYTIQEIRKQRALKIR